MFGLGGVLIVAALGTALVLQGWKGRTPDFDVLTTIDAAQVFVESGSPPDRGVVTSFFSFTPPGAAWLMAPGVLFFDEPRLFEYIGSLGTYVGTLFGVFLLARLFFGSGCALLATILYAFSEHGLLAGSTVWQRYPIHCFTVWTVYWLAKWVLRDNAWSLAAALLTWAAGMYVFLEMAPVILSVPILWLWFRPSVRVLPLLLALSLAIVIWYPYLRFERTRDFADLKSQVLRERIFLGDFAESWCDATSVPESWRRDGAREAAPISQGPETRLVAARRWASERVGLTVGELLLANFNSRIPGGRILLFLLTSVGLFAAALRVGNTTMRHESGVWSRRVLWLAIGLALLSVLLNEVLLARLLTADGALSPSSVFAIRVTEVALLIAGLALMAARRPISLLIEHARSKWSATGPSRPATLLAIAVAVPWILLFLVADGERRYWWIWPLQVTVLAAAVTYVPTRLGAPRWVVALASVGLTVLVLANTVFTARVGDWARNGWAGKDAPEIQVTDGLARRMKSAGEQRAAIGYEIEIWRFMATSNIADRRYKAGAHLDLLLRARHGIQNLNQCAEGVSGADKYRIVQMESRSTSPSGRNRVNSSRTGAFKRVDRIGIYEVVER